MTGPVVRNRPLRYIASFLVLLSAIGTGVGLSYAVPVNAAYHGVLTWGIISAFVLLGLDLMFRIEEGRSFFVSLLETVSRA